MEIIRLKHPHSYKREALPPTAMAMGYFDGVHLGHQKVINEAKKTAELNGWQTAVMTFDPHPSVVLGKDVKHVEYITPLPDKIDFIEQLGVDILFVVHFSTEFASLEPQDFIDQYVIGLNVRHAVAGFDFTYGKFGKGTMSTIEKHSRGKFDCTVVPKLSACGEKVSSTSIRHLLKHGAVDEIPDLLGRHYTISGTVIHGDKRGRTIGFPTANIGLTEDYILPPTGVYAIRIQISGEWHMGVCNLGYKPTFVKEQADQPSVEVHIFNFAGDVYGESAVVEWHLKIREERKFNGIAELVAQIEKDKRKAISYFADEK